MEYRLDAKKIIARFGGRMELWRRLRAAGHDISVKTIEKWAERRSIPSSRLIFLIELSKTEGKPLVLDDYITRDQPR